MKTKMKILSMIILLFTGVTLQSTAQAKLYGKLKKYSDSLPANFSQIPEDRKQTLQEIGDWIISQKTDKKKAVLTVICTQNSRRSHLGQIWIKTAAYYYGIDSIEAFSGGTKSSAFNERAIEALKRAGFSFIKSAGTEPENPRYLASMGSDLGNILMYSKKYNDKQNPQSDFGAIMVCSEADKSCPMVEGATGRFSLPYDDPKFYDNTPSEKLKYDERCKQIATEMFFLFDYVKKKLNLVQEKAKN